MRKNILMPEEMFVKLVKYFLMEDVALEKEISIFLRKKLDQLVMHDLYSKYKTGASEEERKKAIDKYLDRRGMPASFRY